MTVTPFPAPREDGRVLRCRSCGEPVLVFELPTVWLAEDAYQCGNCLRPTGHQSDYDALGAGA